MRWLTPALAAVAVLSGCSRSDVPLRSRPTDVGSARDPARSAADDFGQSKSGPPRAAPVSDLDRFPGREVRAG